ncbi:MAG TPA: selenocysteine-specific translation elongation factor [Solirubrobacteraceae bacterium]|nr:selenocysteine-specific translation elongation factor [Solirubrobacteraceae bacterium]
MGGPAGDGRARVNAVAAPLTLGTAGHIDHGKTALVRALTSVDTDRLPAERARGMTIELGYAPLVLPGGRRLSVIDVPGHERFVRTMVAGATGIDLFLMAIAADDGVMPQTREHAAVLDALGVRLGVVAVTKIDAADPAPAVAAARRLLPGAEVVTCSARTGQGVSDVVAALARAGARVRPRASVTAPAVLHADRAFSVHGAGTVLTGTLWSGTVARGDTLTLLPAGRDSLTVRVRGVQVHGEAVERAVAGQRVAVNLAGVAASAVTRGDALVAHDSPVRATRIIDVALGVNDAALPLPRRVQVHHGTRDVAARLVALGDRYGQLRLEQPLLAAVGDRLVIRRIAPPDTLGGARVLDAAARRRGPRADLHAPGPAAPPSAAPVPAGPRALDPDAITLAARLRAAGHEPPSRAQLGAAARHLDVLRDAGLVVRIGRDLYAHADAIAEVRRQVTAILRAEGTITLARLRDELRTSRKFAQALLEHLDADRLTQRRADDSRVLRRSHRESAQV